MATKKTTGKKRKLNYKQVKAKRRKAAAIKAKRRAKYLKLNARRRSKKCINVANEKEIFTKTIYRRKLTRKYRKELSREFKKGYSPFETETKAGLTLMKTDIAMFNGCKWIWRGCLSLNAMKTAFVRHPMPWVTVANQYTAASGNGTYSQSPQEKICFYQVTNKYEILNNGNYDMNLVIYDIVYKEDCPRPQCTDAHFEWYNVGETANNSIGITQSQQSNQIAYGNPIGLMQSGSNPVNGFVTSGSTADSNIVARSVVKNISTPEFNPTDSYLFNIYCKIIRKKVYRLQPGASMVHTFIHKPKKMVTRGYMGYKYEHFFEGVYTDNTSENIGIKDLTCGCLFKAWGQVVNSSVTSELGVGTMPAVFTVNETSKVKYYYMDPSYVYKFYERIQWSPTEAERANIEVINDVSIKKQGKTDTNGENNDMES